MDKEKFERKICCAFGVLMNSTIMLNPFLFKHYLSIQCNVSINP